MEFLKDKKGVEFNGKITDLTEWGMYVELLENFCEGMIRIADMQDDFYYYDEKSYCVIGKKWNKKYVLGDIVKVKIKRADLVKKQLDFVMSDTII